MATKHKTKKSKKTEPDELIQLKNGNSTSPRGLCPRCRESKNKAFIKVDVTRLGPEGGIQGSKYVKSKGKSLCGSCTIEVFHSLLRTLEKEVDEG